MQTEEERNKRRKESAKRYHATHREEILKKQKEYRDSHREEYLKQSRNYHANNKEKERQYYKNNENKLKKARKKYRQENKEKIKQQVKQYNITNKEHLKECVKDWNFKRKYGITIEQYNQMFDKQEGKCNMCGKHQNELKQALGIDHDHKTGIIRGLLCNSCNRGLGYLNDNADILINGIKHLKSNPLNL